MRRGRSHAGAMDETREINPNRSDFCTGRAIEKYFKKQIERIAGRNNGTPRHCRNQSYANSTDCLRRFEHPGGCIARSAGIGVRDDTRIIVDCADLGFSQRDAKGRP